MGKRKGNSSWVSDFRGHSWSGPWSSLCIPTGITKPSSANCPCRGSQNATCWGLPARKLLSDVCDQSKKPPMVWIGSRDCHTYTAWDGQVSRAPAHTQENQQPLHCKTNSIWKLWVCPTDLHLQTCPLDTSWVLFIPTSSVEEHILTAYIIHIS